MSKAFTRESDDGGMDERPLGRPVLPVGTVNYITRAGADGLKKRLNELLETRRSGAVAKEDERMLESAIRRLQLVLDSVVVQEAPADNEHIAFGAAVTVRRGNGDEEEWQIVGVEETDPANGRISWMSPLAKALVGRKVGERVKFRSPAGMEELTVLTIRYASKQ